MCIQDELYMEKMIRRIRKISEEDLVIESYSDFYGAARRIDIESFDIAYFGDVIGDHSGFELGKYLKIEQPNCILFYVCDDLTYMHEVFKIGAFQIILKTADDLIEHEFHRAVKAYQKVNYQVPFVCEDGEKKVFIPSEILYIKTYKKTTLVVTDQGRFYGKFDNLIKVKRDLKEFHFYQTHPHYFVNIKRVLLIRTGEIMLNNNDYIPISVMNERIIHRAIQADFII